MNPTLLVLAAGLGSRYGGLKQIVPVGKNGETIIDFSIYDAVKSGFDRVVFVIRKDIEKDFREIIGKKYEKKINTGYVFQELEYLPEGFKVPENRIKPWGTGHAILCAGSSIDTPFAVINGDDFYGRNSFETLAEYLNTQDAGSDEYAIVAYILKNTLSEHGYVSRGVCSVDDRNYLKDIIEYSKIKKSGEKVFAGDETDNMTEFNGSEYVSMNLFGFTPGIFGHLERQFRDFLHANQNNIKAELYIPTVVNNLIKTSLARVKVLHSGSSWLGITYQEDKEYVTKTIQGMINADEYPEKLWE